MIPAQVYARVYQFKGESGRSGAAFLVDAPSGLALVTASHNTSGDREEEVAVKQAWADTAPRSMLLERLGSLESTVAAYRFPDEYRPSWLPGTVELDDTGLTYTQDCYILGYPYLLASQLPMAGGSITLEMPIVKKAILAGSVDVEGTRCWVIDAIANPGFSGGPVAFLRPGTTAWHFAGVTLQTMAAPLTDDGEHHSAGLSLCAAVSEVRRLLGEAPATR